MIKLPSSTTLVLISNTLTRLNTHFMKKLLLFALVVLFAVNANAQYHITSAYWGPDTDTSTFSCHFPTSHITTNAYTSGLRITSYYFDGKIKTFNVVDSGINGHATTKFSLREPGKYTIKHVLSLGSTSIDSITTKDELLYCTISIKCFYDSLGTGIFNDTSSKYVTTPLQVQVSLNGLVVDTVNMISGMYYKVNGSAGDIYSFKIILKPGLVVTYPTSGEIYDTVKKISDNYTTKYFGLKCIGLTSNDLAVLPSFRAGTHRFTGNIFIRSLLGCNPLPSTVSMQLSPKYNFYPEFYPKPTSIAGNLVTWDFESIYLLTSGVISADMSALYHTKYGDTLMTKYTITPISGDANPTDNIVIRIDTVKSGYDPNQISVEPGGNIASGTKLKYTIDFENTGNDTAFNISVYDTLSPYMDMNSLELVAATSVMNIAVMTQDGYNLVKFDFPNINLLDSSHHGLCDGAVIFTVNTKQGLSDGTRIDNRAGIYFDYNDVVMTNTVTNIIGFPSGIAALSAASQVQLFPNPVNDILTISTITNAYRALTITNTIGQSVITQTISTPQTNINVKALPAGIYYITLRGESGIKVQKFEKL
ncbi:MAG: putative rane-anchored cell surface protein [Flavipsychrobacter sp.]|nr:putative rane-anchored cell surface protein [Flavipsychrobacter sp.]